MNHEIRMLEHFGPFLADGMLGNQFRSLHVESVWERCDRIAFDFAGVYNMTDSFAFACFGNLAEEHPSDFLSKAVFRNCTDTVKSFISTAVAEGLRAAGEQRA
jgi:hypothetical protein